ncbi:MAG: hypothetical protein V2I56_07850 [Desulfobacteraceae bacterium]|jgi:hypothetical protein|nr:hypothetical protein [Desulfobacteraceae bacterium]
MAILVGYFENENYGLLGPQMAATIIQDHSPYECIVIAVTREYDRAALKKHLADYFGSARPLVGFSALSGREDLFALAKELREEGVLTLLAGPQANVDFLGEEGWQDHPHRFKGLSENFDFGLQGPAEQVVELLHHLDGKEAWSQISGLLYIDRNGHPIQNPSNAWDPQYLGKVSWDNIYRLAGEGLVPIDIGLGQVLQHIGCPHATRTAPLEIDYPVSIGGGQGKPVKLSLKGCSFCDVAADKGYFGKLDGETVFSQIQCLPEAADGRKIPFELINENPLPGLPDLMREVSSRGIKLSQVNLTLRADWLMTGIRHLKAALEIGGELGVYVLLSSIGFESFDDAILKNLNKGLNAKKNIDAVRHIRQLKEEFPEQLGYASREGAIHGFIHPTPWDTGETTASIQKNIALYGLQNDILPPHSTPLIIHHASGLGQWIREIERREKLCFKRLGSIIAWWEAPRRCG